LNQNMPPGVYLKPYDLTIRQRKYNEDVVLDIPDHMWDQYKRRPDCVSDRPTTRKTVLECIFALSRGLFGNKYTVRKVTKRRIGGVDVICHNYSSDLLALRAFVHLANWTDCELEDFEPDVVAAYDLAKRRQKKKTKRPAFCKDMYKKRLSKQKQAKRAALAKKRKNLEACDETANKRHKASVIPVGETHAVFFEGVHEIRKQKEGELNERMSGKRTVAALPVETSFSVAYTAEELQYEHKRQCRQARGVDALVIKSQYRNNIVLKGAAKRVLAQKKYARMLLLSPEELDAMYDALELPNEVLQTTRCKVNQPKKSPRQEQALHHETVNKKQAEADRILKIQQALYDEKLKRQQSGQVEYVEENIMHQAAHDEQVRTQRVAYDAMNTTDDAVYQEEIRFMELLIGRRNHDELLDKGIQSWKTKNFAAWSKKELWQQQLDHELSAACRIEKESAGVNNQQAAGDERIKIQQALYDENMKRQQYGQVEHVMQQEAQYEEVKKQRLKDMRRQTTDVSCGVTYEEEDRFTEFQIERRKQIELLDKGIQFWKANEFYAWSKKELWQQKRDRELSAAVYRQGIPNPYGDFV